MRANDFRVPGIHITHIYVYYIFVLLSARATWLGNEFSEKEKKRIYIYVYIYIEIYKLKREREYRKRYKYSNVSLFSPKYKEI